MGLCGGAWWTAIAEGGSARWKKHSRRSWPRAGFGTEVDGISAGLCAAGQIKFAGWAEIVREP